MPKDIGIPLREILNHPSLAEAKLIAGAGGLDRLVKSVNVMEVPDILDWVKEGELLLTTVYAIREDIGAQARLITELAGKRLAGLAIKPGRYIEKIPDIMVMQAEANSLPLLELPLSASFSDIISPIISEISNKQAMVLKRADEVHARLSQVVLEGGDLQEIADALSELLGNNLVIIETCMKSTVIAPVEQSSLAANMKDTPGQTGNCMLRATNRGWAELSGQKVSFVCTPIYAGKNDYGTITVFEVNNPISERDELTVERAATVAALAMVHHLAVTEVERRYYSEFFNEMLMAGVAEEKKMRQRAKGLGINLASSHAVAVVQLNKRQAPLPDENTLSADWEEDRQQILQQMMQGLRMQFTDIAIGYKFDSLIILVPKQAQTPAKAKSIYKETVSSISSFIRKKTNAIDPAVRVLFGVGRYAGGLTGLQASYREAMQALQIGRNVWPDAETYYFEELGVWRLLGNIADKNELKAFVKETIAPIIEYDKERGTELIKTLEMYFECQGNLKQVAEKMFIHYNTVLYRLERIVQITGINFNNAADNLNFQLALKILKILDV